jgi:hypothetical protein
MKVITQPEGLRVSGQCCVAMIVGVSLNSCLTVFCQDWTDAPRVMRWALKYYHYIPEKRLRRFKKQSQLPNRCLIWSKWSGEWVVYDTGDIYCPTHGLCNYADYDELTGGMLTHYLGFTK